MARDIKLKNRYGQEITYSGVETITMPTPDSSATFGEPKVLQTKTITTNGTHNPDAGFDGFSSVVVDVPNPSTGNLEITSLGQKDVSTYATAEIVASTLTSGNIKVGTNILGIDGSFTNDADATAADLVSGKTAYVNGNKVTGTIGVYSDLS